MEEQYIKGDGPLWEYLNEHPYTIRKRMAEYFLASEPLVIDVGTYKVPLKTNGALISIDPLETFPGAYNKDVKTFLQEVDPINFSLSCLGLAIEGGPEQWDAFIELFKRSKIAVIEYSKDEHNHSHMTEMQVLTTYKDIYFEADLVMPDIETDGIRPYPNRKFLVFK